MFLPAFYGPAAEQILELRGREEILVGAGMPFEKGLAFNRMRILSAGGPLLLSIPVKKSPKGSPVWDIRIDHIQKWQNQHWRSICSSYGKSPFFGYYREELEELFLRKTEFLAEFNSGILAWTLKQYFPKMKVQVNLAEVGNATYAHPGYRTDVFRHENHPVMGLHYRQVFGSEFVSGLSVLDHLFCAGPK